MMHTFLAAIAFAAFTTLGNAPTRFATSTPRLPHCATRAAVSNIAATSYTYAWLPRAVGGGVGLPAIDYVERHWKPQIMSSDTYVALVTGDEWTACKAYIVCRGLLVERNAHGIIVQSIGADKSNVFAVERCDDATLAIVACLWHRDVHKQTQTGQTGQTGQSAVEALEHLIKWHASTFPDDWLIYGGDMYPASPADRESWDTATAQYAERNAESVVESVAEELANSDQLDDCDD